jgi:hypothetical protein
LTNDQDKDLMNELIGLKPFAAARGTTLHFWSEAATCLSNTLVVLVNVKQIRDRLPI